MERKLHVATGAFSYSWRWINEYGYIFGNIYQNDLKKRNIVIQNKITIETLLNNHSFWCRRQDLNLRSIMQRSLNPPPLTTRVPRLVVEA